jgi:hypothetical protein
MKHLFVLPMPETVAHLQALFMDVPFDIDWDRLGVEIGSTEGQLTPKAPTRVYHAVPGALSIWFDSSEGCSFLLLPLFPSPKMAQRHEFVGDAWSRPQFRPVMSFGRLQSNRRNHKAIINSIATALVDTSPVLGFHMETVVEDEAIVPQYSDFYTDYIERGGISNQVLLEQDEGIE